MTTQTPDLATAEREHERAARAHQEAAEFANELRVKRTQAIRETNEPATRKITASEFASKDRAFASLASQIEQAEAKEDSLRAPAAAEELERARKRAKEDARYADDKDVCAARAKLRVLEDRQATLMAERDRVFSELGEAQLAYEGLLRERELGELSGGDKALGATKKRREELKKENEEIIDSLRGVSAAIPELTSRLDAALAAAGQRSIEAYDKNHRMRVDEILGALDRAGELLDQERAGQREFEKTHVLAKAPKTCRPFPSITIGLRGGPIELGQDGFARLVEELRQLGHDVAKA